jgi:hypothetical protein
MITPKYIELNIQEIEETTKHIEINSKAFPLNEEAIKQISDIETFDNSKVNIVVNEVEGVYRRLDGYSTVKGLISYRDTLEAAYGDLKLSVKVIKIPIKEELIWIRDNQTTRRNLTEEFKKEIQKQNRIEQLNLGREYNSVKKTHGTNQYTEPSLRSGQEKKAVHSTLTDRTIRRYGKTAELIDVIIPQGCASSNCRFEGAEGHTYNPLKKREEIIKEITRRLEYYFIEGYVSAEVLNHIYNKLLCDYTEGNYTIYEFKGKQLPIDFQVKHEHIRDLIIRKAFIDEATEPDNNKIINISKITKNAIDTLKEDMENSIEAVENRKLKKESKSTIPSTATNTQTPLAENTVKKQKVEYVNVTDYTKQDIENNPFPTNTEMKNTHGGNKVSMLSNVYTEPSVENKISENYDEGYAKGYADAKEEFTANIEAAKKVLEDHKSRINPNRGFTPDEAQYIGAAFLETINEALLNLN